MPNGFTTPFVSGIYTSPNTIPIAELIAKQGADAAAARERQGQITGQAFNAIGQTIADLPVRIAQARAANQEATQRQQQIETYNQNKAGLAKASSLVSQYIGPDGLPDLPGLSKAMAEQNVPLTVQTPVLAHAKDLYDIGTKARADRVDRQADVANSILNSIDQHNIDPWVAVASGMSVAKNAHIANDQELGALTEQLIQAPDAAAIKGVLQQVRTLSPKYAPKLITLPGTPEGGAPATIQSVDASGHATTVASGSPGGPKPKTADEIAQDAYVGSLKKPNGTKWEDLTSDERAGYEQWKASQGPVSMEQKPVLLDGKPDLVDYNPRTGKSSKNGVDVSDRVKPVPSAAQVSINAGQLSDAALDQAATKYLQTGELPPGYGTAGTMQKTAIMNRAAQMDPKAALARNQATFKADSANLTNLTKTEGALSAFENAAGKNIKQFTDLAAKLPDSGVPWLNTPLRQLDDKLVGAEWLPAVQAARKIALREVARVTNDPGLKGQLTDSARADVNEMADGNATIAQMKRVFPVLLQDMANVHSGLKDEIEAVKNGLGSNPAASVANAAAPVPPGQKRIYGPNGQTAIGPASTPTPAGWSDTPMGAR